MTGDIRQLLDLAQLRCDAAARATARGAAEVRRAEDTVATALAHAEAVHAAAEAERAAARTAFLGAARSRVAVEDLLAGLSGLRDREAAALASVLAAREAVAVAKAALARAREAEGAARLVLHKRAEIARPLFRAERRRMELRAEAEAAEGWRTPGRTP